jgi:glycosyltransferase involved in cell wall biosynthesis
MIDASGVGVYLKGVLPHFIQSENNFLLLGNREQLQYFSLNANVEIIDCYVKPFSIKELFFFPVKILKKINKTDSFFSPFFNIPSGIKVPVFTTIHDIIFSDMPEYVSKIGLAARFWFYRKAYKKSLKIFTVSQFSKSRIEHHLGNEKPVIVTHSAIKPMFLEYRAKAKNKPKTETIIFIGNIKKHKGVDCLLDAYLLAKEEGLPHKLIIIGSKDNFRTADNSILQKINSVESDITFTGFVSDEKLLEYLASAALLVLPSLYEGFGLVPLEALVLGTHALISDIPVLKEIYGDYPVTFFRANDVKDLKEKIIDLLLNKPIPSPALSDKLLTKFTFEKTASVILQNICKL